MTQHEFTNQFIVNMEIERIKHNMSQKEMADYFEISLSTYKKIISGDTSKLDMYITYKMYMLTNKFACELCGYSDEYVQTITAIKNLDSRCLKIIRDLAEVLSEKI